MVLREVDPADPLVVNVVCPDAMATVVPDEGPFIHAPELSIVIATVIMESADVCR